MIKACSFLPAVTQMIYDMELDDQLYGVTFECPEFALAKKTKVVRSVLEGKKYNSREIDTIFSHSKAEKKSLYYVDEESLKSILPDVIFTQDICEVCQIDTACTAAAVAKLPKHVKLVTISPNSLEDVFSSVVTIAKTFNEQKKAYQHLTQLKNRLNQVIDTQRIYRLVPKRVLLLEWLNPIYNCGHWMPHQIAYAGGIDMLSNPSGNSARISWEKITVYDPEIIIISACGYSANRALEDMPILTSKKEWKNLMAVKSKKVYLIDFDLFTQPSASTLVDGIELLAGLFNPHIFQIPCHLKNKVKRAF